MAAQPTQPAAVAEPEGVPHPSLSTAQPVAPSVPVTAADALKAAAAQGVAAEGIPHLGGELDYPGGHPLHTAWLISYDKKGKAVAGVQQNNGFTRANGQNSASPSKDEALPRVLGRFNTVETFWQHYVYLERPVDVIKDQTVHFFREMYPLRGEGYKGYQGAGCWLLKVHKNLAESGRMWERLLLATIGETFEDLSVMGCSLTMGNHQMLLFGLWFTKAKADLERKERIRLRMREVTGLTELLAVQAAAQSTVADAAAVVDGGGGPRSGGGGGGGGGGKPEKLVLYMDLEFYDYSSASAISHPANAQLARVLAVDLSQSSFGGNGGGGGGTKHHAHGKLAKKMGGGGGGGGSGGGGGGGGGGEKAKGGAVAASAAVERAAAKPEVEAQKAHKAE